MLAPHPHLEVGWTTTRRATALADGEAHFRYDLQNTLKAFGSEDGREARQAFTEKRPPAFQGT